MQTQEETQQKQTLTFIIESRDSIQKQIELRNLFTKDELNRVYTTMGKSIENYDSKNIKVSCYYDFDNQEYCVDVGYYKDDSVIGVTTLTVDDEIGLCRDFDEATYKRIALRIFYTVMRNMEDNGVIFDQSEDVVSDYLGAISVTTEYKNLDY